jgi:hypothetical protein
MGYHGLTGQRLTTKCLHLHPESTVFILGGFTGSEIDAVVGQPYRTIYGYDWNAISHGNVLIGADGYPTMSSK